MSMTLICRLCIVYSACDKTIWLCKSSCRIFQPTERDENPRWYFMVRSSGAFILLFLIRMAGLLSPEKLSCEPFTRFRIRRPGCKHDHRMRSAACGWSSSVTYVALWRIPTGACIYATSKHLRLTTRRPRRKYWYGRIRSS